MTTSNIVKLSAGQSITLLVESAAEVDGQYGKQLRLDGQDASNADVTIFLPLESALRQLERFGASASTVKGEVLKIEKVEKNGRTFINIDRAAGSPSNGRGRPVAATTITRSAPTEPEAPLPWERERIASLTKHYEGCFNDALAIARKSGVEISLQGVSAMAATIFLATKGEVA